MGATADNIKKEIIRAYTELKDIKQKDLVELRYIKFRNMGTFRELEVRS